MTESSENPAMTVQEVADYYSFSCSTIYRWAREGKLPGKKIGGSWRFSRKQVEKLLEAGYEDPDKLANLHPRESRVAISSNPAAKTDKADNGAL